MASESVHIKERKGRIIREEASHRTYICSFLEHALTLIMLVLMETLNKERDARQPKRKDKLSLHLLCCVYNLPVPRSQLNCHLQVIKYGLCMRFSTMPSFHTVQLKWRGGYDSLILSPAQPQLSSWWIIHQQGRAGVLCVTYTPHPSVPLLPGARAMEHGSRGGLRGRSQGKCYLETWMHFSIVLSLIRLETEFYSFYTPQNTDGHLVRFSKTPMTFIGVRRC